MGLIKDIAVFILVPLAASLFNLLKIFVVPHCMAFDSTDDAMHTFVNLSSAQAILKTWHMPMMNVFNGFGTPLIGDALTYPFAVQSWTYWFFPYPIAMEINRFVLGFLTTLLLTVYFRKYCSRLTSSVCAVLVMYTPGFIWHFAHHHYQASVLFFTVLLLLQERFARNPRFSNYLWLSLAFILVFLSTSINLVFLMLPFLFFNQLFLTGMNRRAMGCLVLAATAGILFDLPDIIYLLIAAEHSMRIEQWYGGATHLGVASRVSILILGLAAFGLWFLKERRHNKEVLRIIILGLLPLGTVILLTRAPSLWKAIPFLKSTDITRFLWLSNIFLMLGVGFGLDRLRQGASLNRFWFLGFYFLAAAEFCLLTINKEWSWHHYKYEIFAFLVVAGAVATFLNLKSRSLTSALEARVYYGFIAVVVCLFQIIVAADRILGYKNLEVCREGHCFSEAQTDLFQPQDLLPHLQPHSRVAIDEISWKGLDLKMTRNGFFSTSGRCVFVNKDFSLYLMAHHLIDVDQIPFSYHFKQPWNKQLLSDLGIRYVIQKNFDPLLQKEGWRYLAHDGELFLFENPLPTGLVYLIDAHHQKTCIADNQIVYAGNGMQIQLPAISSPQQVVVTFLDVSGWLAWVDGHPAVITHTADMLMRIQVNKGNGVLKLDFRPFEWWYFCIPVVLAVIVLPAGVYIFLFRKQMGIESHEF